MKEFGAPDDPAEVRVDRDRAGQLLEFATRQDILMSHPVLGAWAVRAWSASQGWNKADAIHLIDAIVYADYRRSAIAGRPPATTADLRDRARSAPEIAPVVEFALAA